MMNKKYLLYLVLLLAGIVFWFVKTGTVQQNGELNRHPVELMYSKHARCRMDCRHIDESEVREILEKGVLNKNKIEQDSRGKTFPLEGYTHDRQRVRIVFAPKGNKMLVVTVIDLDREWHCDCN